MGFKPFIGEFGFTISAILGLCVFFALLLVLGTLLSPLGLADQTIGWIAAGTFFVGFWGIGLKFLIDW